MHAGRPRSRKQRMANHHGIGSHGAPGLTAKSRHPGSDVGKGNAGKMILSITIDRIESVKSFPDEFLSFRLREKLIEARESGNGRALIH
jgi:hypothetical protein